MDDQRRTPATFRTYFAVWAALIALTAVTVGASYLDMKHLAIFTCLLIAVVKSGLVTLYFMHVRFEKPIFIIMIAAVVVTYVVFVGLTFTDYAYR